MNADLFKLYDLAWAKVAGHPWGPCIVFNEPKTHDFIKITRSKNNFYVKFFGFIKWLDN